MPQIDLISLRQGYESDWTATNPVLAPGEAGSEIDTGRLKVGNGTNTWIELPYTSPGDVGPPSLVVGPVPPTDTTILWADTTEDGYAGGVFTDVVDGLTPASGGGAVNYLRADGTWATPAGGGGGDGGVQIEDLPYVNVKDHGAVGDGVTDDSAAFQAAIDDLSGTNGGGTLFVPDGVYMVANVQLKQGITVLGSSSTQYGFTGAGYGAVLKIPTTAVDAAVVGFQITNAGTGYSSAPTVTISGGGGSGATATAAVSGGAVTGVTLTDPGVGYTSTPTVALTGGAGSGATVDAVRGATVFFTSGSKLLAGNLQGLTFRGTKFAGHSWAGVIIHNSFGYRITECDFYDFDLQAVWQVAGQSMIVSTGKVFGACRTGVGVNYGYWLGALQIDGTDAFISNLEVGGYKSEDQTKLWNAAVMLGGGGANDLVNIVAEGSDVGVRIHSSNNVCTNVRADINYGHGFYITRENAGVSAPLANRLIGCWGHRNSKYITNTFDNFRVETGKSINYTIIVGARSSYESADGYAHRYGLFDGGINGFCNGFSDQGAATGWASTGGAFGSGFGTVAGDPLIPATNATTFDVSRKSYVRITNNAATTILTMSGGVHGQIVRIQCTDDLTSIGNNSLSANGICVRGRTGITKMKPYGVYQFICLGSTWYAMDTGERGIVTHTGTAITGVLADGGSYLRFTGTNPTYTVPPNSSVAFPVGTQIDGIGSATAMTLIQGAGVTITKARTLVTVGAGSAWTLIKTGTDTWDLIGDLV